MFIIKLINLHHVSDLDHHWAAFAVTCHHRTISGFFFHPSDDSGAWLATRNNAERHTKINCRQTSNCFIIFWSPLCDINLWSRSQYLVSDWASLNCSYFNKCCTIDGRLLMCNKFLWAQPKVIQSSWCFIVLGLGKESPQVAIDVKLGSDWIALVSCNNGQRWMPWSRSERLRNFGNGWIECKMNLKFNN